jgi:alkaline phosphatase D
MPTPGLDRRSFLAGAGALGATAALGPARSPAGATDAPEVALSHGVASFDPTDTGVLLWTRATVQDPGLEAVELAWSVTAPDGSTAAEGTALATA